MSLNKKGRNSKIRKNIKIRMYWDETMPMCNRNGGNWRTYSIIVWEDNEPYHAKLWSD